MREKGWDVSLVNDVGGGDGDDFLDGGEALGDLVPAVHAHGDVAFLQRGGADVGGGGGVGDHFLDGGGDEGGFVDGESAAEAGVAAAVAAFGAEDLAGEVVGDAEFGFFFVADVAGDFAMGAEAADEALGEKGADGGGNEEGLHAHVDETAEAAEGIVGVERGEDEVAGEGGADGDFCGFEVANFPDHDDVGVGTEDGAEGGGEGQADFAFHGDLHDTRELVFDGVFDGDDAAVWMVYLGEEGVKAGGFSGTGGAGDEDDAVGEVEQGLDAFAHEGLHVQLLDAEFFLVEEAQGDALAFHGWHGGDADVDGLALELEVDASVLREAALGDVEARHDFESGDDGALQRLDVFRDGDFDEPAVDAVADAEVGGEGLDVDIGGALVEGLADDLVDEFYHAGFFVVVVINDVGFIVSFEAVEVEFAAFEDLLEGIGTDTVEAAEGFVNAAAGGHEPVDGDIEFLGDGLAGDEIEGIEGGEVEAFFTVFFGDGDGEEAVAEGDARAAEFAERQGVFCGGDAIEPWDADVDGEFVEVFFFVEDVGIKHVIKGGLLP